MWTGLRVSCGHREIRLAMRTSSATTVCAINVHQPPVSGRKPSQHGYFGKSVSLNRVSNCAGRLVPAGGQPPVIRHNNADVTQQQTPPPWCSMIERVAGYTRIATAGFVLEVSSPFRDLPNMSYLRRKLEWETDEAAAQTERLH